MIEIDFAGENQANLFFAELEHLGEKIKKIPKRAIERISILLQKAVKQKISDKGLIKTGTLRRSIFPFTVQVGVNDYNGGVFTHIKYAPTIEGGSKPHEIRPKNKQSLMFTLSNGTVVFAKKVNHPGTVGYHIFKEALEENYNTIFAIIREERDISIK